MERKKGNRFAACLLAGLLLLSAAGMTACGKGGGDTSSLTQPQKAEQELKTTISAAVDGLSNRTEELKIGSVYLDESQLKLVVVAQEIDEALKAAVEEYISSDFVIYRTTEEEKPQNLG